MTTTLAVTNTPSKAWARALTYTAPIARNPEVTLPTLIDELSTTYGERVALIGEDATFSYVALSARVNQFARWAHGQGIGRGDVVCIVMHNSPDYLAAWLGITRTGAIASLINTNLVGESLTHVIQTASPKCIIVGADLADAVASAVTHMDSGAPCWVYGSEPSAHAREWLNPGLESQPATPLTAAECAPPSTQDRALYIYTSGTTGLPKAALVTHHRILQWSYWFAGLMDTSQNDRMYNCLPMYHSVGGVVAIGSLLVRGGSVVIRRKFSARAFWNDIKATECTLLQYIGELCRFLVNSPPSPHERQHQIRIACGNGLRADIWEPFQERFAIPRILEFYAATEANFSLYNCEGKAGAIGRIPAFLAHRFPTALVAFDHERGEPLRDENGFCRRCGVDEVGEAIGKIAPNETAPESQFAGYTDRSASDRKILRDVFVEGDAWYRSGDLMRRDGAGFFYFIDRVGDTFRWKGENVSTAEVADALCSFDQVRDAVVYGVPVPGYDGRAGMAAIVSNGDFDPEAFRRHLTARLPEYACPVFIRILNEIETTATFKPKKQDLVRVGFDPNQTTDALFVNHRESDAFLRLDAAVFERIQSGAVRF